MDSTHLIFLGIIGMLLTVIGFGIAFYIGSKSNKVEVKLTEVQKSLRDLNRINGKDDTE
tara:strand:- start:15620 stop:15796 length:177 start_codon:yes stop_codon:yes gene_type:complete